MATDMQGYVKTQGYAGRRQCDDRGRSGALHLQSNESHMKIIGHYKGQKGSFPFKLQRDSGPVNTLVWDF